MPGQFIKSKTPLSYGYLFSNGVNCWQCTAKIVLKPFLLSNTTMQQTFSVFPHDDNHVKIFLVNFSPHFQTIISELV
jgi:hypothetical protein